MRHCLIVLGMHRSGTSALAGAMSRLGVNFGVDLLEAQDDNVKGYFEHRQVVEIHQRLLEVSGSVWDDLAPLRLFDTGSNTRADALQQQLRTLLDETFGTTLWAVKDPRMCRLMPFWKPVLAQLEVAPRIVIASRDARQVAASLARRNGFSPEKSGALWLRHMLDAERDTREYPRTFVTFSSLLEDPITTLSGIGDALEVAWPVPPDEAAGELRDFVDPALPGSMREEDPDFGRFTDLVRELESLLEEAGDSPTTPEAFDDVRDRTASALGNIDPLVVEHLHEFSRRHVADRLWREHRSLEAQISQTSERLGGGIDNLEQSFSDCRGELLALTERLDNLDPATGTQGWAASVDSSITDLQDHVRETLAHLTATVGAAEAGVAHLAHELDEARTVIRRWQEDVDVEGSLVRLFEATERVAELDRRVQTLEDRGSWWSRWISAMLGRRTVSEADKTPRG